MKNIQAQYTDLLEGKMSQANFLRNVRMQFPQYVSNVSSFDDSVKILKGKRILSEIKIEELSPDTKLSAFNKASQKANAANKDNDPLEKDKRNSQLRTFGGTLDPTTQPKLDAIAGSDLEIKAAMIPAGHGGVDDQSILLRVNRQGNNIANISVQKTSYKMGGGSKDFGDDVSRKLKTAIKYVQDHELAADSINEAKQLEGVYGHNPSAEVTLYPNFDTVNYTQLIKGMKFELAQMDEITDANMLLAKKMALKKLSKDPMAYRELVVANQNAVTEMDKTLKMKEVKKGDLVDKANGMKVIKKDAPAAANKSKKFTNKVEKIKQMTQTPKGAKGIEKVMEVPGKEKVIALKEEVSPIASQWKVGTKFKNLKNNQVTTIEKFDNLGNVIISTDAMPGKQWTWPAEELSNMIKKGELELMEVSNSKVQALKEAILKEFENDSHVEQISKGARVMTRDKKKVGVVDKIEHDTATVKLDDGTMEHVQLNVLTARDVPPKEQSELEKKPDLGARAQNWLSNTVKADREGPEPESKPNRLKNLKERLKKALKKEDLFKKGKSTVTAGTPTSQAALKQQGYTQVPNTGDIKAL